MSSGFIAELSNWPSIETGPGWGAVSSHNSIRLYLKGPYLTYFLDFFPFWGDGGLGYAVAL